MNSVVIYLHSPSPFFSPFHHLSCSPSVIHLFFILILYSKVISLIYIIFLLHLSFQTVLSFLFLPIFYQCLLIPFHYSLAVISLAFFLCFTAFHM